MLCEGQKIKAKDILWCELYSGGIARAELPQKNVALMSRRKFSVTSSSNKAHYLSTERSYIIETLAIDITACLNIVTKTIGCNIHWLDRLNAFA